MLELRSPKTMHMIDKNRRILIVDDDHINRELLSHLLREYYQVDMAAGGQEAIDRLLDEHFDLVLLDVMMPVVDGLKVLKTIRSHHELDDMPIILVSAMSDEQDIVAGLQSGANDYITKPMDIGVVLARVKTQLTIKDLLDERKKTIEDLELADKIRSQLFRIASHDLKSPLGNIRMAVHLLRSEFGENDNVMKILDTITLTADNMRDVITNFLEMVEIQSGKVTVKSESVDLHSVIMNVLTQHEYTASQKDIKLNFGDTSGCVDGDTQRVVQIVANLVSNAVKYSPYEHTVTVWTEAHNDFWRVLVADEGPGIPENERHLLFQEFSRLSTRPTGGESSTGIGLWIVNHLVEVQGGQVGVDFPDSGGSVFWVELPACSTAS